MKDDVYSPFKPAFHREKLDQLRRGELITPTFVQWDLSNACNLRCNFCFYHIYPLTDWNPKDQMRAKIVKRVLSELKELDVKAIEWTGGGEPTLWGDSDGTDWEDIFYGAKDLGFEQALVTNGTLLSDVGIDAIRDFEWVRFSIDAATPETFKAIKGADLFDNTIENLKKLLEVRDPKNVIGFSFIVCRENHREIYEAAKLAKELGCDNVRFSLAMTPRRERLFDDIWDECVRQIELAKELQDEDFRVFAFSNRIYELALKVLSPHCYYCQFVGVITPRGVYPCCRLKDEAWSNFGSLDKSTFKYVWFRDKRREFVERVVKYGCPYDCWQTEKNLFIHYLLQESPRHANFI